MTIEADCCFGEHHAVFSLRGLDPRYHAAALDLAFVRDGDDFTRAFPAGSPGVQHIGSNFRKAAAAVVRQAARVEPVPWQAALRLWLERLDGHKVWWFLGGSAALATRGLPVEPRDLDIITDDDGAQRLGTILADVLVEPVVPVSGRMCNWFGRAFLGARCE